MNPLMIGMVLLVALAISGRKAKAPSAPSTPGGLSAELVKKIADATGARNAAALRAIAASLEKSHPDIAEELRRAADTFDEQDTIEPVQPPTVLFPPIGSIPLPEEPAPVILAPPDAEEVSGPTKPPLPQQPGQPPATPPKAPAEPLEPVAPPFVPPEVTEPIPVVQLPPPNAIEIPPEIVEALPTPIQDVLQPPPDAIEVPPEIVEALPEVPAVLDVIKPPPIIDVPAPPPDAEPVDVRIPDPTTSTGRVGLMLHQSAPKGPVKDVALLGQWKKEVAVTGKAHLYGPGTAHALMIRGVVPPTPWDWPKDKGAAVKTHINRLKSMANTDPARAEEWNAAADLAKQEA